MDMCVLRSPNSQQFSDEVIGGVVQRSRPSRDAFIVQPGSTMTMEAWPRPSGPQCWSTPKTREHRREFVAPSERRWGTHQGETKPKAKAESPPSTERKRKKQPSEIHSSTSSTSRADQEPIELTEEHTRTKHVQAVVELVVSEKERLRNLRRMRQIRYRNKKENYANTLEEETRSLQDEIEKLKQQQRTASEPVTAVESVWSVATEYFRLFHYGICRQPANLESSDSDAAPQPSVQLDFVRSKMASDVVLDVGSGRDTLIKEWSCISQSFEDFEMELERLEKGPADTLVATTTTSVTISERTLRHVFPHLCSSQISRAFIADMLLGQRIVMRGSTRFEWDVAFDRVKSVVSHSDMLTPVLRVLGNLEDVSAVFEGSFVSPDFHWTASL